MQTLLKNKIRKQDKEIDIMDLGQSNKIKKFTEWVLKYKYVCIIATLGLVLACGSGGRFLVFNNSYKIFFGENNPQLKSFEKMQKIYSKSDNVLVAIEPQDGRIFTSHNLTLIAELTEKLWQVSYATRVDSLTNFQNSHADGDTLVVEDLFSRGVTYSAEDIKKIKQTAIQDPVLRNRLISPSGAVSGINITFNLPENESNAPIEIANQVRKIVSQFQSEHPEIKTHLTGEVMLDTAFAEVATGDMKRLTPAMYLIIFIFCAIVLRSFWGTLATALVLLFSTVTAMGCAGWLGIQLTAPSAVAPTIILTVAIADSIHFLMTILNEMRKGVSKKDAIIHSFYVNLKPVFLTTFTTAISFLTLNFSDAPPFHHLGNITAIGSAAAFVYSVIFLPAILAIMPLKVKVRPETVPMSETFFQGLLSFILRRRTMILWAFTLLTLGLGLKIPFIQLTDKFVTYFDTKIQFRKDTDFVVKNLTGAYQIEYSLDSKKSGSVTDPKFLKKVDDFSTWFRSQDEVLNVTSMADFMKRLNKNMHQDNPLEYRLPETKELASQYLLMYEMSLPYGLDLNNQINIDKSSTRFIVVIKDVESGKIKELAERGQHWFKTNAPQYGISDGASPTVMFSHIADRNIKGMAWGTLFDFIAVTACATFFLRSFWYGFLAFFANFIPIILTFGLWGFLYGKVGFASSIVAPVAFGIIIDDTIHFLTKYAKARKEMGLSVEHSIAFSFSNTGEAILSTSLILIAGFSVMAFSPFLINSSLGRLSALAIGLAIIVDILFLPALLATVEGSSKPKKWFFHKSDSIKGTVHSIPFICLLFVLFPCSLHAEASDSKGYDIAVKACKQTKGFGDFSADLNMILKNTQGEISRRKIQVRAFEVINDGEKIISIFIEPKDVYGTTLLSFTHKKIPDDRWLYIPALKRVKRIANKSQSGPFMGSEFAYEDLSSPELEKYTYKFLRDEKFDKLDCAVIERIPIDPDSGYSKQNIWYDKSEFLTRKIEYFDRASRLVKIFTPKDYQKHIGFFWSANDFYMENIQTGKSTRILWDNFKFKNGVTEKDFDLSALKRSEQ